MNLPSAEIIIIGAGAIGAAVAYQLAQHGITDVLVVDKGYPGHGTTRHAAGLIGQVRGSVEYTHLTMQTIDVFNQLESDGYNIGWRQSGSLRISENPGRTAQFGELIDISQQAGLHAELITADELEQRFPFLKCETVDSAIWCVADGYVEPLQLTQAYLTAAQDKGIRLLTGITVTDVGLSNGKITGIQTNMGMIPCRAVIDAGGIFLGQIARSQQTGPPVVTPIRHGLIITEPIAAIPNDLPVIRLPDRSTYFRRHESGGLMIGGFSHEEYTLNTETISIDESYPQVTPANEKLARYHNHAAAFLPELIEIQIAHTQTGLPTCTPDGEFLMGSYMGMEVYIVVGGCNVHGISGGVGLAQMVVAHIADETPSDYSDLMRPGRFPDAMTRDEITAQSQQIYADYYRLPRKYEEPAQ